MKAKLKRLAFRIWNMNRQQIIWRHRMWYFSFLYKRSKFVAINPCDIDDSHRVISAYTLSLKLYSFCFPQSVNVVICCSFRCYTCVLFPLKIKSSRSMAGMNNLFSIGWEAVWQTILSSNLSQPCPHSYVRNTYINAWIFIDDIQTTDFELCWKGAILKNATTVLATLSQKNIIWQSQIELVGKFIS